MCRTQVVNEPKLAQAGPSQWTEQVLYTEYLGTTPLNDIKVTRTYPDPDWPSGAPTTHANTIDTRYTGTMVASQTNPTTTYHRYHHGDMVGSTVQLSDNTGGPAIPKFNQAYSAFGERVGAHTDPMMDTRYQHKRVGLRVRAAHPRRSPHGTGPADFNANGTVDTPTSPFFPAGSATRVLDTSRRPERHAPAKRFAQGGNQGPD